MSSEPHSRHPLNSTAAALTAALKDIGDIKNSSAAATTDLRPIVIYGLSDTKAACQAALEQGVREIAFLSSSGVAHSLGPQWFQELIANTAAMFSDLDITGILDCGPFEGHVMNALNHGIMHVYYHGDGEAAEKLRAIAAKTGAVIYKSFPAILDLKNEPDVLAACREWFKGPDNLRGSQGFATKTG